MTGAGGSGPTETRRTPRDTADPERTRRTAGSDRTRRSTDPDQTSRTVDRARRAARRAAEADAHLANQETDVHRPVSGRPAPDQPLRARWDPIDEPGRPRADRAKDRKKQSAVGRFVTTYGWRAYAIPVLVVLTIVMIVLTVQSHQDGGSDRVVDSDPDAVRNTNVRDQTTAIGAPPKSVPLEQLPAGVLPAGGPFTEKGAAGYHVVPGTTTRVGTGGQEYTYTVEVENGLASGDFGGDPTFAKLIDTTLANPKSWIGDGTVSFRRIDNGEPDFRVTLTSPDTTRQLCGYEIKLETSCYYPPESRVTLNEARWVRGATSYQGDDLGYRQYLINHEIGHAIGFEAHEPCKMNGSLAPIMMQQTFGTANSEIMALDPDMKANRDYVCNPNPWPFPER
ncbi:DUF3152 domain-containing protein [Williamsia muralis]|uniref:DUF3152 domain-containing protein n=1 Tax=Williamsia marianensis TaxID=85044 RepID=A0ABU4ELP4_WILMA|nr:MULTISPECIES: DUF3152 domain-containing protein [Williamsia]MDV7132170.1 DUF3152 domain-containing protein [Williamsia muralis]PVY34307.1 uncharacterized protein DUF3152 [Williamsia marianensis]